MSFRNPRLCSSVKILNLITFRPNVRHFSSIYRHQLCANHNRLVKLYSSTSFHKRFASSQESSDVKCVENVTTTSTSDNGLVSEPKTPDPNEIDLKDFIIPEPPKPPSDPVIPEELLTCADVGLTWWFPTGAIYSGLTFLHNYLPWWASIGVVTCTARALMSPLILIGQRHTASMQRIGPQLTELTTKLRDARTSGNMIGQMKIGMKLQTLMTENGMSPGKMAKNQLIVPITQGILFGSFFMTLRTMCKYPIESMQTGGLFWFTDLTSADALAILPVLCGASMFLVMKVGIEYGLNANSKVQAPWWSTAMVYGVPPCTAFFFWILDFQSAIMLYFLFSNVISIGQTFLFNTPFMRRKFNLPKMDIFEKSEEPKTEKKGFVKSIKSKFGELKGSIDTRKMSAAEFEKAGTGPIRKTYKYDPTAKPRT